MTRESRVRVSKEYGQVLVPACDACIRASKLPCPTYLSRRRVHVRLASRFSLLAPQGAVRTAVRAGRKAGRVPRDKARLWVGRLGSRTWVSGWCAEMCGACGHGREGRNDGRHDRCEGSRELHTFESAGWRTKEGGRRSRSRSRSLCRRCRRLLRREPRGEVCSVNGSDR